MDYTKYSTNELLDVKANIDPDSPNYPTLLAELEKRMPEILERQQRVKEEAFSIAEQRVKVIGYFQLIGAMLIAGMWGWSVFNGNATLLSSIFALFFIALNAVAGYTAIKEMIDKYWISMLNQALQIPSIAIANIHINYSGIGHISGWISWTKVANIGVSAEFLPGFYFQQYSGVLTDQWLAIDGLAVMFFLALLTVKSRGQ